VTEAAVQRRTRELLRVARHPDLRRIEAGFGALAIADNATWIAITVYAFARGGVAEAGLVSVVQLAPAMVVAPFAAYAGDRFRTDRVIALGYVVQSVAMLATAVAMWRDAPALTVYTLATVVAIALTFTRPAIGAWLPAVTSTPADLTAANVSVGVLEHLGAFVGPALAGLLLQGSDGPARVFAVMGSASPSPPSPRAACGSTERW
jgi:MFS family permease